MGEDAKPSTMNFRGQLLDDVLPFWEGHGIDDEAGGFWTNLHRDGSRYGSGNKYLVMQTRMIYSFATGYRVSGDRRHLDLAARGVDFFLRKFYDAKRGGWCWATTREGRPIDTAKRPYGLAFAVYALAEYARLVGDRVALSRAVETWDLLEKHGWDHERGGFYYELGEDWTPVNTTKRIDVMLHNMEATSALYAATGDRRYLDFVTRLCDTIVSRTWDAEHRCTREWFYQDWREDVTNTGGMVNFGHLVETAWFMAAIAGHTGRQDYLDFACAEFDYAVRYGWDDQHGGLYSHATPAGELTNRSKTWWMQSELLDALVILYRLTGEERYLQRLHRQAEYVANCQRDPLFGEWYTLCDEVGSPIDARKGSEWKAAYHVVQGLYQAERHLGAADHKRSAGGDWLDWAL